jgi:hypothetical protein
MSQDKQSAIEAAARAVANHLTPGWEKIHADKTHWRATHGVLEGIYSDENEPFQDDCREAARAAILAYLSALVEDEEAVEAVAQTLCGLANPPESLIDPADHSEFVRTEAIGYRAEARAVLRTLATRAQGESL